jgi:hypothetical protein
MKKETNPVQQRMEYLTDRWNDIPKQKYKIIRTFIEKGDEQMIEAFYTYMLGIGVPIADIAINFGTGFDDPNLFSENLVKELEDLVNLWNEADFSKTSLDKEVIHWRPDYRMGNNKNPAKLFAGNLHNLIQSLNLQKGRFLIANLTLPYIYHKKDIHKWLRAYLSLEDIHPQLKVVITDTKGMDIYRDLCALCSRDIYDWEPEIDTPTVISKVAAMGDPQHPDTEYRQCFVKMLKYFGENKSGETRKAGAICLKIACANADKDPYWIAQIVTVNILLSNDYFRNKAYDQALETAGQAIKIGETIPKILGETIGCGILAQALMNKATMLCTRNKWNESRVLYERAADCYIKSTVFISAIEACRMAAYCGKKDYRTDYVLDNLVKGYELSNQVDDTTLRNSSFPLLLLHLTKTDYKQKITREELNARATQIYGKNWEEKIRQKWSQVDFDALYADNSFVTLPDNIES